MDSDFFKKEKTLVKYVSLWDGKIRFGFRFRIDDYGISHILTRTFESKPVVDTGRVILKTYVKLFNRYL